MQPPGTRYSLEVNPRIPKRLARLEELAANLWYSWDRPTRALFAKLNPTLWDAVAHSPRALLKRVDEQRLPGLLAAEEIGVGAGDGLEELPEDHPGLKPERGSSS